MSIANAGGVSAINAYDEYGIPNDTNQGRFQYTGQAWLPELGMYYYKARMYSATLGRFLQTDLIGYKDQINLYEYVGDDPVDGKDPSGLTCETPTGSIICQKTETIKIGLSGDGTHIFIATRFVNTGKIIRVESMATGKTNDESWLFDVAAGAVSVARGVLARRAGSFLLGIVGTGERLATRAELQVSRDAAVEVIKKHPGANGIFFPIWGSGVDGAGAALAKSSLSAPAGLTPELAAAYRTTLDYQVALGRETGKQLISDVVKMRLQILDRLGL